MSNKLIKSTLAAMVVTALAAGGAIAQTNGAAETAGNTMNTPAATANTNQVNPNANVNQVNPNTRLGNTNTMSIAEAGNVNSHSTTGDVNASETNPNNMMNRNAMARDTVANNNMANNNMARNNMTTGNNTAAGGATAGNYADDSNITARVKKAFDDDSLIDQSDITVRTENGVVALSGFVDSTEKRNRAVQLARDVQGVTNVTDQLNIRANKDTTVQSYTSDAAITAEVKARLLTTDNVPSMSVSVETVDGVVQLTGNVDRRAQAVAAETAARQVQGVKSVKNDITVRN